MTHVETLEYSDTRKKQRKAGQARGRWQSPTRNQAVPTLGGFSSSPFPSLPVTCKPNQGRQVFPMHCTPETGVAMIGRETAENNATGPRGSGRDVSRFEIFPCRHCPPRESGAVVDLTVGLTTPRLVGLVSSQCDVRRHISR